MGKATLAILITLMLVTGCSNTIWSKFQDMQCVSDCDDPLRRKEFSQPVYQSVNMFLGECLCLLVFYLLKSRLNPYRSPSPSDPPTPNESHHAIPAPPPFLSKAKYQALSQSAPDDSGIALDDDQYIPGTPPHDARRGLAGIVAAKMVRPRGGGDDSVPPFGAHGPTPAPVSAVIEDDESDIDGEGLDGWKVLLFWLPATFDICGTTLMNVGLLFTPPSIFQMIRGALPLWVGLFSVIFLHRRLPPSKWASLFIIMSGVALVGLAGTLGGKDEATADDGTVVISDEVEMAAKTLLGVLLIFFAQIFTASQFVVEEKIMGRYEVPPLRAVGLEGAFGFLTTLVGMALLHFLVGQTPAGQGGYFDVRTGWSQITSNPTIAWSSVAIAFSIACFNFAGLAVTKSVSATARSVIDTCRSIGIWAFSLAVGWETFKPLQLAGFGLLVVGTFLFNDIWEFPVWVLRIFGEDTKDSEEEYTHGNGGGHEEVPYIRVQDTEPATGYNYAYGNANTNAVQEEWNAVAGGSGIQTRFGSGVVTPKWDDVRTSESQENTPLLRD